MNETVIFIWITIAVIAIFDIYIIYKEDKFESISAWIIRESRTKPLLVLLFGITLGHLFWSMDSFDWMTKEQLIEKCKPYIEVDK